MVFDPTQDRREFYRVPYKTPLKYRSYAVTRSNPSAATAAEASAAVSENISQSGILFQTKDDPPAISSIVWMNMDFRTLNICKEIDGRALILKNGLLGKVVRVEEDSKNSNAYDVGVCFLTKNQKDAKEVQQILSEVSAENV